MLRMSAWKKVVWLEGTKEVEGVVPDCWISGKTLFWPRVPNAEKYLRERRTPASNWKTFQIMKIKFQCGKKTDFTVYHLRHKFHN